MVHKKTHAAKILTAVLCAVLSLSVFLRCGIRADAEETLGGVTFSALCTSGLSGFKTDTSDPGQYYSDLNRTYFGFHSSYECSVYNNYYMDSGLKKAFGTALTLHIGFTQNLTVSEMYHDYNASSYEHYTVIPQKQYAEYYLIIDNQEYFICDSNTVEGAEAWVSIEECPTNTYFSIKTVVRGSVYYSAVREGTATFFSSPLFSAVSDITLTCFDVYYRDNDSGNLRSYVIQNYNAINTLRSETAANAQTQQNLTQQQTAQQHQDAQDALTEQQKQTEIQEEQKETTKGIFSKITDFFGSFFDKLSDLVLHLVVPSSDELMTFLDEVNTWFGDRLGFIYYPFDLAVRIVSAFAGGSADTSFTVPALSLNLMGTQYTIWDSFTVNLDEFGIFTYVRYFTSALLCLGVGRLAVNKWDDWIGGKKT